LTKKWLASLGLLLLCAGQVWGQALSQQRTGTYVATESNPGTCSAETLSAADIAAQARHAVLVIPPVDRNGTTCQWFLTSTITLFSPVYIPPPTSLGPVVKIISGQVLQLEVCPTMGPWQAWDANEGSTGTVILPTVGSCTAYPRAWWGNDPAGLQTFVVLQDDAEVCAAGEFGASCGTPSNISLIETQIIDEDTDQVNPGTTIYGHHTIEIDTDGSGHITSVANPQVTAGVNGQEIVICGKSDTNYLTLSDGSGLELRSTIDLQNLVCLRLGYRTTDNLWHERGRSTLLGSAGTDTQVIYNDSGALAGDADFTFNNTTKRAHVAGGVSSDCDPTTEDCTQTGFHEADDHPADTADSTLYEYNVVNNCLEWFVGNNILRRDCGVKEVCYSLESPTDADNFLVKKFRESATVLAMHCLVGASTSAVVTYQECDGNGGSCSTIESVTCGTTNTADNGIDNASIDAGDWIRIDIGTVTGTVGQVNACLYYR